MIKKKCTACLQLKGSESYYAAKRGLYGLAAVCKPCQADQQRARRARPEQAKLEYDRYRKKYLEKRDAKRKEQGWAPPDHSRSKACTKCGVLKDVESFYKKGDAFKSECKDCSKQRVAEWVSKNPEKVKARREVWCAKNVERRRGYAASNWERNKRSPSFRLNAWMRTALKRSLLAKNDLRTYEIFGYKAENLRIHLEKQFEEGMSWANFGDWHIDHILPLSSFKIENADSPDLKAAWALSNLRPLWKQENLRKRDKIMFLI